MRIGLDPHHPSYPQFYVALDLLHDRFTAFASPFNVANDLAKTVFDPKAAGQEAGLSNGETTLLGRLVGRGRSRSTLFEPPATILAKRQEVIVKLQKGLTEVLEVGSVSASRLSLLSDQVLLTLTPRDVWQLVDGNAANLAKLLREQPSDVIVAFFKAWGRGAKNEEDFVPLGKALVALWNSNGERGRVTTREAVRLALEDPAAVTVMQKALSLHGSDGDLMTAQMDMYAEIVGTDHLAGVINPYEHFVVSGVLRPEDLEGVHRKRAIGQALAMLEEIDEHESIGGKKVWVTAAGNSWTPGLRRTFRPGPSLLKEEQHHWRKAAVAMLVRLKANGRSVRDHLAGELPPARELRLRNFDLSEQGAGVWPMEKLFNEKEALYFGALDELDPRYIAKNYLKKLLKIYKNLPPITYDDVIQMFGLHRGSVRHFLLETLREEEKTYADYGNPKAKGTSSLTRADATPAVEALIQQGDAGIDFLFGYLSAFYSTWARIFIYVAEQVATPLAHQKLTDLYSARPKLFGLASHKTDTELVDALLFTLTKIDSNKNYQGPKATEVYLHYLFEGWGKVDLTLSLLAIEHLREGDELEAFAHRVEESDMLRLFFEAASTEGTEAMTQLIVRDFDLKGEQDHRRTSWAVDISFNPSLLAVIALLGEVRITGKEPYKSDAVLALFKLYHALHGKVLDEPLQKWLAARECSGYLERVLQNLSTQGSAEQFADPADLAFFRSRPS